MVYKRYIKRGGKLCGPYYYESYRDKNGKVISKFVSGPTKKDKVIDKFNPKLNKNFRKTLNVVFLVLAMFLIVAVFFIGVVQLKNKGKLSGFGIFGITGLGPATNQSWNVTGPGGIAYGVDVDSSGNVYVTGTNNTDFLTIKYNSTGGEVWNASYNGGGNDIAYGIAADNSGNVYVTGTNGTDYLTIKYNSTGGEVWNATIDVGGALDTARGIFVDDSYNVYVSGSGNGKFFTIKYNSTGGQVWNATGPGNGAFGIAVDSFQNVYVTGYKSGVGGDDYCTIKYNSTGGYVWNVNFTGSGTGEDARGIAVDNSGNVYVTGYAFGSPWDIFTIKYNSSGAGVWNATFDSGAAVSDLGYGIALDSNKNIYVAGTNGSDSLLIEYNSTGGLVWNLTFDVGIGQNDYATGIAIDSSDYIYLSGYKGSIPYNYYTIKYNTGIISDTIYPLFSDYSDNSGTLTSSGTAWFNASIKNTNGSALLQINNANYTARNSTANVYNVSANFSSAGTYNYRWISWGNGTNNNFNISESRSYVVNSVPDTPSSGGGSGGLIGGKPIIKNESCVSKWVCEEWTSCENGTQKRVCKDNSVCGREDIREIILCAGCIPRWICRGWDKCLDGFRKKVCKDISCGLDDAEEIIDCNTEIIEEKPSEEIPENFPLQLFLGGKTFNEFFIPKTKICEEWSECETYYNFNNLNNISLQGVKKRLCSYGINSNAKFFEYENCFLKKAALIRQVYRCSKNYVEVYNLDNNVLGRMELVKGIHEIFNVQFPLDNPVYCYYCYDKIKNYDEDEIDCNYETGKSCPVCKNT
jgi:hypothetical protein